MLNDRLWTKNFVAIGFCALFQLLVFTSLMATLPVYVKDFLQGDDRQAGLTLTFFFLGAVLSRPLAGKWLNRWDNKIVLLLSLAAFFAATAMYQYVHGLTLLYVLRFLHGVGFGIGNTACTAIVARIIPEHRKGEGMGFFTMAISMAMVLGPMGGLTVSAEMSFVALFDICILLGLLSLVCGAAVRVSGGPAEAASRGRGGWENYFEPAVVPLAVSGSLLALGFGGVITFVPIYAKELGLAEYARYFFLAYAVVLLLSRPLAGRIFDRYGVKVVYYPTALLYVAGLILLSRAWGPGSLILSGVLIGLGYGTLFSILQTVVFQLVARGRQGMAAGTFLLFWDGGVGAGALLLGMVASQAGFGAMYQVTTLIVLLSVAIFFFRVTGKAALEPRK